MSHQHTDLETTPHPPNTPAHHNGHSTIIFKLKGSRIPDPYGVQPKHKTLTPTVLRRKWHLIRSFLTHTLRLTTAQREVTLRLLRLYAYYPHVYPKAKQISASPGCSIRTFWTTIAILKQTGLLTVVQRYVLREHAQISNLYLLDKLALAITRFLSEHGLRFTPAWIHALLQLPGTQFWPHIYHWPRAACTPPP